MAEMPTQRPPSFSVALLVLIASPTTSLLITSPELSAVQYTEQYPNWNNKLAIIAGNILKNIVVSKQESYHYYW